MASYVEAPRLTTVPQGFKYRCTGGEYGRRDANPGRTLTMGGGAGQAPPFSCGNPMR